MKYTIRGCNINMLLERPKPTKLKVLVACEHSGRVRYAFRSLGHDAWSCDLLPTAADPTYHLQCDVRDVLYKGWDLLIAHPPCTHLATSGACRFHYKKDVQEEALQFVLLLLNSGIPKIAIENPVSIISTRIRKPDQIIEPWMFGHRQTKRTCLWLDNLPHLCPTKIEQWRNKKAILNMNIKDRAHKRSLTYFGVANAMAEQWGGKL